jgi:hypothetical protein
VAVAACCWYVTVSTLGNMQAGLLLGKCLGADKVLKEDKIIIFNTEAHDAMNWETQFQVAKMAKKSDAALSLKVRVTDGIWPPMNVCDNAKTPAKWLQAGRRGSWCISLMGECGEQRNGIWRHQGLGTAGQTGGSKQ